MAIAIPPKKAHKAGHILVLVDVGLREERALAKGAAPAY